jgi:hypothetical protein
MMMAPIATIPPTTPPTIAPTGVLLGEVGRGLTDGLIELDELDVVTGVSDGVMGLEGTDPMVL